MDDLDRFYALVLRNNDLLIKNSKYTDIAEYAGNIFTFAISPNPAEIIDKKIQEILILAMGFVKYCGLANSLSDLESVEAFRIFVVNIAQLGPIDTDSAIHSVAQIIKT